MPLIRGANVTYTAGNDKCNDLVTDDTYFYTGSQASPGRAIKTAISPFAQTAVATLSRDVSLGCTVLGGYAFTTMYPSALTAAEAGWVIKTNTTTMVEDSSTQLWTPGAMSKRKPVAIYNDGTYLYVGSNAYDPGSGWLDTQVTQMDTSFGSITDVSLPTKGSTVVPSSVDGDGSNVYFSVGRGPTTDTTDSVAKLSTSGFSYVSKWDLPSGADVSDIVCVPPKLYVGTVGGDVYRISTGGMTSDGVVINQKSGVGGMICMNGLLYISSLSGGTLFAYDLSTYDRVESIQFTGTGGGSGAGPTVGQFGPGTAGTVIYWGLYGSSPGGIQQLKNVYTGIFSSTYPTSQQPTVTSAFAGGPITPGPTSNEIPTTKQNITFKSGQTGGSSGSNSGNNRSMTTRMSSTNEFLQAAGAGDPHFYGFEGESWFFNGDIGGYYNLFSDDGIQINSLFRHWTTSGVANFTAMEEIGITIITNKVPKIKNAKKKLFKKIIGELIEIKITANHSISVNNEKICDSLDPILEFTNDFKDYFTEEEIEKFKQTEGYGTFMKGYIIRFWPYNFIITQSTDGVNAPYLNIIVRLDGNTTNRPHGIIGQTADFDGKLKEKMDGEELDYKVSDLWANDFKFNRFRR